MTALLLDTTVLIDTEREPDSLDRLIADDDTVAIAATARASDRTVVTADPEGFEGLSGVSIATYR